MAFSQVHCVSFSTPLYERLPRILFPHLVMAFWYVSHKHPYSAYLQWRAGWFSVLFHYLINRDQDANQISDTYQYGFQIYHFTGQQASQPYLIRLCKNPTAIGAGSAEVPNDVGLATQWDKVQATAYISIYIIHFK